MCHAKTGPQVLPEYVRRNVSVSVSPSALKLQDTDTMSVFALGLDLGLTWVFQVKYKTRPVVRKPHGFELTCT